MARSMSTITPRAQELNYLFQVAHVHKGKTYGQKVRDEQLYFSDVEGTRTQFTKKQFRDIRQKYDVPISTKLVWAIIEQMLSYLTGAKPYGRLVASAEVTQEFTMAYEKAIEAVWYENKVNRELTRMTRDKLIQGYGAILVRPNDFYNESTFGVVIEYKDWKTVFVDPFANKPDFSDADYICIAEYLPIQKIEKRFGITVPKDEVADSDLWVDIGVTPYEQADAVLMGTTQPAWDSSMGPNAQRKYKMNWVRDWYEKKLVNVYISDTGHVSKERPTPTTIPNPEKEQLAQQIMQMQQMQQQAAQGQQQAADASAQVAGMEAAAAETAQISAQETSDQLEGQIQQLMEAYAALPDTVPAYTMQPIAMDSAHKKNIPDNANRPQPVIIRSFTKQTRKLITQTLMIGSKIVDERVLPTDEYPIIIDVLSYDRTFAKTYGIVHYIKDLQNAMNKFWGLLIYDMQTNSNRKTWLPSAAVADRDQLENDYARPNAILTYEADASLPNGGQPTIQEPAPLNQAITQIIGLLQQIVEFSTGINAVMQGQPTPAGPDTYGGIQTYQTMGTQRIKLYSRTMQDAMEQLVYVISCYLAAYAPKDKVIKYLDEDGDQQELMLFEPQEDMKFNVRMNLTSNLPTQRQMAAQLLGTISGQTKNPVVADLLIKYTLEMMDMPEAKKVAEQVDIVKNLQSQLEQIQQQLMDVSTEKGQLEQQLFQTQIETKRKEAEMEIEKQVAIRKEQIKNSTDEELDAIEREGVDGSDVQMPDLTAPQQPQMPTQGAGNDIPF